MWLACRSSEYSVSNSANATFFLSLRKTHIEEATNLHRAKFGAQAEKSIERLLNTVLRCWCLLVEYYLNSSFPLNSIIA